MQTQTSPGPIKRKDARGSRQRVAAGVFQRAGRYIISYVGPDGREHVETLGLIRKPGQRAGITLKDAIAAREKKRVDLRSGEAVAPTRMTVGECWADFAESLEARLASGEISKRTRDVYLQRWRSHLEEPLGRIQLQQLRAEHVARLIHAMREAGSSSWTSNGAVVVLSAMLRHALVRGWIAVSPLQRLAKGERPRPRNKRKIRLLTPEELARVVSFATKRWKPLFECVARTGMRISEALGLRWQDVDFKEGVIRIEQQLGRDGKLTRLKTERSRRAVPIGSELRRILLEHQMASGRPAGDAFVFGGSTGAPPTYRNACRELSRVLTKAKIHWDEETERVSWHGLRHGAVSALIRSGADPVRVAQFVGDRVQTVMSVYASEWQEASDENLGDALDAALNVTG